MKNKWYRLLVGAVALGPSPLRLCFIPTHLSARMAFTHPSSPSSTPPVSVKSPAADLPWEPLRPPKRRHPLTSFLAALLTSLALYIFIQGASDWDALVELAVKVWGHHASKRRFEAVRTTKRLREASGS